MILFLIGFNQEQLVKDFGRLNQGRFNDVEDFMAADPYRQRCSSSVQVQTLSRVWIFWCPDFCLVPDLSLD